MRILDQKCCALAAISLILAGCGGDTLESATSGGSTAVDACTLLTAAEIEATMGVTPGAVERPQSFSCQWANPDSPFPVAYIGVSTPNIGSWEEYRTDMIEQEAGDPDKIGERIDIGRFGFYQEEVSIIQVQTDTELLITLSVRGSSREQILELAHKAVARVH